MVKLRFRKAFGFRTFEAIEVALYQQLGQLPRSVWIDRMILPTTQQLNRGSGPRLSHVGW